MSRQKVGLLVCFGAGVGATLLVQRAVTNGRESRLLAPVDQFWPPVSGGPLTSPSPLRGGDTSDEDDGAPTGHQQDRPEPAPAPEEATRHRRLAGATRALASTTFSIQLPVGALAAPGAGPVTRWIEAEPTPTDRLAGVAPDRKRPPTRT